MPATSRKPVLLLVGCGKMGGALLRGWLKKNIADAIHIIEPHGIEDTLADSNLVTVYDSAEQFRAKNIKPDAVILAVKPQVMRAVCTALKPAVPDDALILSIAAGQTIARFEEYFGTAQPVIRVMPNTPAAIGKGMNVAVANAHATDAQRTLTDSLLQASGKVAWVEGENLMNAVTAVSGSGPAYIFLLIETLAQAGTDAGLPEDLAMTLARQTVIGAAALAESDAATPASQLRENVTSPGGTTAAALDVLMNGEFQQILTRAITAAKKRGEELAQ